MSAYIKIVGAVALYGFELTDNDLREIGEFTRENISRWMESSHSRSLFEVGIYGYEDFHAVCDDIDIPWNTLEVVCPRCGTVYQSEAAQIGKHLHCAQCGAAVPVVAMSDDEANEMFRRLWHSQWHEVPSKEENTQSWAPIRGEQ